jgi:hypothetical protein
LLSNGVTGWGKVHGNGDFAKDMQDFPFGGVMKIHCGLKAISRTGVCKRYYFAGLVVDFGLTAGVDKGTERSNTFPRSRK